MRLWNGFTGEALTALQGHADDVQAVAFSSIGALASASSDGTVWLWNSVSGTVINIFMGHTSDVNAVSFHPDGAILASGSRDATVRLWEVETGATLATLEASAPVRDVKYSPDGAVLAALDEGGLIWLWDGTSGRRWATRCKAPTNVRSPSARRLAAGSAAPGGTIRLWDVAGRAGRHADVRGGRDQPYPSFNLDGTLLATGGNDGGAAVGHDGPILEPANTLPGVVHMRIDRITGQSFPNL